MKWRLFIIGAVLFYVSACFSQAVDNTIHVQQFPGTTVGQKVANAMATCGTNTSVPCILTLDPSLAAYAPGTMPSLCSHCFLWDWRSGPPEGGSNIGYIINITDPPYSAKCDGVTDDSAAIQRAVNSGATFINFPAQTSFGGGDGCLFNSTINVPAGLSETINGNGSRLEYGGSGTAFNQGADGVLTFNNFILILGGTGTPTGFTVHSGGCDTQADLVLNVGLAGFGHAGTKLMNVDECTDVFMQDMWTDADIAAQDSLFYVNGLLQMFGGAGITFDSMVQVSIHGLWNQGPLVTPGIEISNTLSLPGISYGIHDSRFDQVEAAGVAIIVDDGATDTLSGNFTWQNSGGEALDGAGNPQANLQILESTSNVAQNLIDPLIIPSQAAGSGHNCLQIDSVGFVTQAAGPCSSFQSNQSQTVSGDTAVTFSTPFTDASTIAVSYGSIEPSGDTGYCSTVAGSITTTGFTIHPNNQNPINCGWIAVGR